MIDIFLGRKLGEKKICCHHAHQTAPDSGVMSRPPSNLVDDRRGGRGLGGGRGIVAVHGHERLGFVALCRRSVNR